MAAQPQIRLTQSLRDLIRSGGPIPLSQFMGLAVSHYYAGRDPLGACGDFITAPEISQTFGEMIGLWLAVMWQQMGAPKRVVVAELGPGRGTLMADMLRAAQMVPAFLPAAEIWLVETSPTLRAAQQRKLSGYDVQWAERVEDLPTGPLLLVANEFFDALPIEQAVRVQGQWRQRLVGLGPDESLVFVPGEPLDLPYDGEDGTIRESCPEARRIIAMLGRRVAQLGGAMLVVDYGYDRSQAGDSLQAVKDHRFHPVLSDPGEADVTAHVDFYALAEAAIPARAYGPVGQGAFLRAMGIETRLQSLMARNADQMTQTLIAGVKRWVDPDAMGTVFRVMALTHPALPLPPGFG